MRLRILSSSRMISASASEAAVPVGCCCPEASDPEPRPAGSVGAVWEKAHEAASSVVNTPIKQIFRADESCFHLLRSVIKRTIPFDTHLCRPTLDWKLNGIKAV